jgi:protoporphyrinogen oxidase
MTKSPGNEVSVAIIGAGISGLRCADVLLRSGAKVKVYEARDRIGGRVHQIPVGGYLVDLGANWIHSPDGSPIKGLAERVKAITFRRPKDQGVVGSDGERKPREVAAWMHSKRLEVLDKAYTYSYECRDQIGADASLMDFFEDELGKDLKEDPEMLQEMLHEAQRWGQMVGEPVDQQSLRFLSLEEGVGGVDLFVASSYKDIVDLISGPVLDRNVIQLGAEVEEIISETTPESSSVTIKTVDGTRNMFDEVVVTCPLGWLKLNKSRAFTPALPPRLSQAIDNFKYVDI